MKDYYQILQLPRSAGQTEIKKAYRRLAILYHPDKNPSTGAEQVFKEINEAYEVLGDPNNRAKYDYQITNPFATVVTAPQRPAHRDPAYKRKKRPGVRVKGEKERILETMATMLPFANKIVYVSFAVSMFLAMDFLLPYRISQETIRYAAKERMYSQRSSLWTIHTDQGKIIDLPYGISDYFLVGDMIEIRSSQFLGIPVRVAGSRIADGKSGSVRIGKTIYGNFIFAPIVLLITSCFGVYHRRKIEYGFNAGVICSLILILTIVIYILIH
jgi:hypothetical protein